MINHIFNHCFLCWTSPRRPNQLLWDRPGVPMPIFHQGKVLLFRPGSPWKKRADIRIIVIMIIMLIVIIYNDIYICIYICIYMYILIFGCQSYWLVSQYSYGLVYNPHQTRSYSIGITYFRTNQQVFWMAQL